MEFQGGDDVPNDHAPEERTLTKREKEILTKLDKGLTYKEIANNICVSPHTVRTHIKNIYGKLQAKNKLDALVKAGAHHTLIR